MKQLQSIRLHNTHEYNCGLLSKGMLTSESHLSTFNALLFRVYKYALNIPQCFMQNT